MRAVLAAARLHFPQQVFAVRKYEHIQSAGANLKPNLRIETLQRDYRATVPGAAANCGEVAAAMSGYAPEAPFSMGLESEDYCERCQLAAAIAHVQFAASRTG